MFAAAIQCICSGVKPARSRNGCLTELPVELWVQQLHAECVELYRRVTAATGSTQYVLTPTSGFSQASGYFTQGVVTCTAGNNVGAFSDGQTARFRNADPDESLAFACERRRHVQRNRRLLQDDDRMLGSSASKRNTGQQLNQLRWNTVHPAERDELITQCLLPKNSARSLSRKLKVGFQLPTEDGAA